MNSEELPPLCAPLTMHMHALLPADRPAMLLSVKPHKGRRHRIEPMRQPMHRFNVYTAAVQARVDDENRAAAQLAAENSPDNRCKEPRLAGELLVNFNNLQNVQDNNIRSVDIEHLTTIRFEVVQGENVYPATAFSF